jgi:hypothetical protein
LSKENKYELFSERELARKLDVPRHETKNKAINCKKSQPKERKGRK